MNTASLEQALVLLHALFACAAAASLTAAEPEKESEQIRLGSRLELFIDRYLMDKLEGAILKMHSPQPVPLSATPIKGYYMTVIKDGNLYRAYYRGYDVGYKGGTQDGNPGEITCYAESSDGHNWRYPQLGLFKVNGPEGNNVILAHAAPCSHNFSPLLDTRPGVPAGERFKALAGTHPGGLFAFASSDGIQWKKMRDEPVIKSADFAFDSQNVAFWSPSENRYVCYYRSWTTAQGKLRTISRTTSDDFIQWAAATPMNPNLPGEHLYTSNTHPYFRAPHIYIALPTRFLPARGDSTDILLMTSRGGSRYDRSFLEAFIRPGLDPERWGNRANYAALNVVPTGPAEMSVYHAPSGCRYVLRTDGFASVNAGHAGGEMVTKPFTFSGKELVLNYSTSAAGSVRVEVQSPDGKAVPHFGLSDCKPLVGDKIEGGVSWLQGSDVGSLSGKPVRLRFALNDADLYSMRFR